MFMRILPFLSYFYNTTNNTTLTYTDGRVITYNNIPQNETFKYNYDLQYNNLIDTQDDISTENIYYYNNKPVRINIVEISQNANENIIIEPAIASKTLASKSQISKIANRENAIVAINGGYFKPQTGVPLGTLMINKKIY